MLMYSLQETTHMELSETAMLSAVASLTPFSDFNQSPRNMYQCQVVGSQGDTGTLLAGGQVAETPVLAAATCTYRVVPLLKDTV